MRRRRRTINDRKSNISDIVGRKTKTDSIFEIECFPAIFVAPPRQTHAQPHRDWLEKNLEELLLGLGWRGISYRTIWVNLPNNLIWDDLFFSEFPISYVEKKVLFTIDMCRAYQGRIEMESCNKTHRMAIFDIARENRYRDLRGADKNTKISVEILVENDCECFIDDERNREGALYVYSWKNRCNNKIRKRKSDGKA